MIVPSIVVCEKPCFITIVVMATQARPDYKCCFLVDAIGKPSIMLSALDVAESVGERRFDGDTGRSHEKTAMRWSRDKR